MCTHSLLDFFEVYCSIDLKVSLFYFLCYLYTDL
nr:MAG TPA: hypothetical protein [Caudoviricetes sp.]